MKYLKRYSPFLEAFQAKDKYNAITKIVEYITSATGYKLYPYNETFHIKKDDGTQLEGQLYLALDDELALRFNWDNTDKRSELHSIDLWKAFKFEEKPDFTLFLNGNSVVPVLKDVVKFISEPEKMVEETHQHELTESVDDIDEEEETDNNLLKNQLEDTQKKLRRARSPEKKKEYQELIDKLTVEISKDEYTETDSTKSVKSDLGKEAKLNVFKTIELFTIQVAKSKSNSLIITGTPGIGKTAGVTDTLASFGMHQGNAYIKVSGDISTAGLYQTLFINRHKLIIFDDCDSVFKDSDSVNMLKAALDTYDKREISNMKKTYYSADGMTDLDMEVKYEQDPTKLPNQFVFDGKIIFISNLPGEKFDKALLSRSLHVDVHLTRQELLERMREIIQKLLPAESLNKKFEALEYLNYLSDNYKLKFDLNIRSLIHAVNIRCNEENEKVESIGGESIPIWKLLVRQYMTR